jgi:NTP pyrophosphatase (non-canonical NTP hydrolase)
MDYNDNNTTIQTLKIAVRKFVEDREWTKYHTPRNLAESIAIEASELLELYQWGLNGTTEDSARAGKVEEELADVVIYCIGLANVMGIDLVNAILDKMRKNEEKYPIDKYKGSYSKPVSG